MDEAKIGRAYYDVLGAIKAQVATNIVQVCREMNVDQETIRKLVFVAESTVESSGGNAFPAILKSCK
jgi:hypothetical protein